jgi:hypothetical protein
MSIEKNIHFSFDLNQPTETKQQDEYILKVNFLFHLISTFFFISHLIHQMWAINPAHA